MWLRTWLMMSGGFVGRKSNINNCMEARNGVEETKYICLILKDEVLGSVRENNRRKRST